MIVSLQLSLTPSDNDYVMIPCTFEPNNEGEFELKVTASNDIMLEREKEK